MYRVTNSFCADYGWARILLRAGYAVMYPNFRGGSGRGPKFANYAIGGIGTADYDDVVTLTNHCIKSKLSDPNNLIIGGWSNGGFLTYLAAVRNGLHGHGWRFKGGIAGAGITDWDSMVLTSESCSFDAELAGVAPWDANKQNVEGRKGSPIYEFKDAAKEKRIPDMLLLHGEKDVNVPISQAWGFQRAMKKAGLPCEFVTYPRAGHTLNERKQLVDMYQRVLRFCEERMSS